LFCTISLSVFCKPVSVLSLPATWRTTSISALVVWGYWPKMPTSATSASSAGKSARTV
jgi:hypothetical protein